MREDGSAPLATVGWHIVASHPSFDARDYGTRTFGELVATLTDVEVRREQAPSGAIHVFACRAGRRLSDRAQVALAVPVESRE